MTNCSLYSREYKINDSISVMIPTIEDIIADEDAYYATVAMIVSTPYDMMVQLDDAGIDFSEITDWQLFCLTFNDLQKRDTSLIFGDLDLGDFDFAINNQNGNVVLIGRTTGIVIDQAIHDQICKVLRKILKFEKNSKKPGNEEARKYMIERARKKLKRAQKKPRQSQLEGIIISLVNTSEFSYTYETVKDLTIYQLNMSLHQIVRKISFDNLMIGCYAGTVDTKELNHDDLNWITTQI